MPLFEFRCRECDHRFEDIFRDVGETGEAECPECGSRDVERLQSGFASPGVSRKDSSASSGCASRGGFR